MAETRLETERLILRNWREEDRPLFHRINSDPEVMEFFPFTRDRETTDRIMDEVRERNTSNGFGFMAIASRTTDTAIGFCGLSNITFQHPVLNGKMEIGWRLEPAYWGNGYVTEAAQRWVRYGFEELGLSAIFSFAVPQNTRSIAVMKRLGMIRDQELDFDHPAVSDDHHRLRRHVVYKSLRPGTQEQDIP